MSSSNNYDHSRRSRGRHGLYDLSEMLVSTHASERFVERFGEYFDAQDYAKILQSGLSSCRKLGTNPSNHAEAFLCLFEQVPAVLMVQGEQILTFLTCEQFQTVMADFGRVRWPHKPGRWLQRIQARKRPN